MIFTLSKNKGLGRVISFLLCLTLALDLFILSYADDIHVKKNLNHEILVSKTILTVEIGFVSNTNIENKVFSQYINLLPVLKFHDQISDNKLKEFGQLRYISFSEPLKFQTFLISHFSTST